MRGWGRGRWSGWSGNSASGEQSNQDIAPHPLREPIYSQCQARFRPIRRTRRKDLKNLPLLSVDSHSASSTSDVLGLVDSHDGVALVVDRDETRVPGIASGTVVDCSVGGVVPLPEVEMVKERVSLL